MNGCARLFESERTSLGHIDIIDACQLQTESRAQRSALSKVVKICEKENGKPCVSLGLRVGGGARFELRRRTIPSPSPPSPPSQLGGRVGGAVCRTRPMCATDVLRPAVSRSAAIPSAESSIKSTPLAPTALTPLAMAEFAEEKLKEAGAHGLHRVPKSTVDPCSALLAPSRHRPSKSRSF